MARSLRLTSAAAALALLAALAPPAQAKKISAVEPFDPKPLKEALRLNAGGELGKDNALRAEVEALLGWTQAANTTLGGARLSAQAMLRALRRAGCIHHRLGAKAPKDLPEKCGEPAKEIGKRDILYFKNQMVYFQEVYKLLREFYSGAQGISRRLETLAGPDGELAQDGRRWRLSELCGGGEAKGRLAERAEQAIKELPAEPAQAGNAAAARRNLEQIRDFCPAARKMHAAAQAWIPPVNEGKESLDRIMRFYYVGDAASGDKGLDAENPRSWHLYKRLQETAEGRLKLEKLRASLDEKLDAQAWDKLLGRLKEASELKPGSGPPPAYEYEHALPGMRPIGTAVGGETPQ